MEEQDPLSPTFLRVLTDPSPVPQAEREVFSGRSLCQAYARYLIRGYLKFTLEVTEGQEMVISPYLVVFSVFLCYLLTTIYLSASSSIFPCLLSRFLFRGGEKMKSAYSI